MSILLALAIQAWWEGRQDLAVERVLLQGLRSDFLANREQLDRMLLVHDEFQRLLTDLERASPTQLATVTRDSANLMARAMQGSATFDSRDATLDAAIASGTLAVLRDVRLRELLAQWKAEVDDLDEESATYRDAATKARNRVAALGGPWIDEAGISLPPPDLLAAAADQELQALLRTKRWVGIVYVDELNRFLALTDTILSVIESN